MTCQEPIEAALLADYWTAQLAPAEEENVELHLLACDACGARLHQIIALAEAIRNLAREGSLQLILSEAFLERAAAGGLRIRSYQLGPGDSVQCTIAAEDDLLIARMAADLSGARRLDLALRDPSGAELMRLTDIPFLENAGAVLWQQSSTFAKGAPTSTLIARLLSVDDSGQEQLLGEYTYHHTRTIPGPALW